MFTAHAHTFKVDDHFHLEMIVNINVIIGDRGLADRFFIEYRRDPGKVYSKDIFIMK